MGYSFYGHSDDCAEVEGDIREEVDCYDSVVRFRIGDASGGLFVTVGYATGDAGVWSFTVEQIDEDIDVPWSVSVGPGHGYSLRVNVDCPKRTPLAYARRLKSEQEWDDEKILVGVA